MSVIKVKYKGKWVEPEDVQGLREAQQKPAEPPAVDVATLPDRKALDPDVPIAKLGDDRPEVRAYITKNGKLRGGLTPQQRTLAEDILAKYGIDAVETAFDRLLIYVRHSEISVPTTLQAAFCDTYGNPVYENFPPVLAECVSRNVMKEFCGSQAEEPLLIFKIRKTQTEFVLEIKVDQFGVPVSQMLEKLRPVPKKFRKGMRHDGNYNRSVSDSRTPRGTPKR